MKIAIVGALSEEIEILKERVKNQSCIKIADREFILGKLDIHHVIIAKSGIGKVNAAITVTLLTQYFDCDFLINIGTAGSYDNALKIGDIIVPTELRYHDVDVTAFDFDYGQIPYAPSYFKPDQALIEIAESCKDELQPYNLVKRLMLSGDSFTINFEKAQVITQRFLNPVAADMEACAIAHTCHNLKISFIIIRSISDFITSEAHIEFKNYLNLAAKNSTFFMLTLLEIISNYLNS